MTVPSVVVVPLSFSNPVVIPVTWVPTGFPTSQLVTIPSQSNAVIIDYTNVPTEVPTLVIQPVSPTQVVAVPTFVIQRCSNALLPPTDSLNIPFSWTSPVVVPASQVSGLNTNQIVFVASSPSVVIIENSNVPLDVSTSVVLPVSQYVSVPSTVVVPNSWVPVVIPATWAFELSTNQIVVISS